MASSPRSRASRTLPKTLTGVLAAVALAVLAALGIKTDWFHKPTPPTERHTAARTAPPGNLPNTPGSFETAKKVLYTQVYADHRVTFYCGCRYDASKCVDLARCGLEALADKPSGSRQNTFFPPRSSAISAPAGATLATFPSASKAAARPSRAASVARRSIRYSRPPTTTCLISSRQ